MKAWKFNVNLTMEEAKAFRRWFHDKSIKPEDDTYTIGKVLSALDNFIKTHDK